MFTLSLSEEPLIQAAALSDKQDGDLRWDPSNCGHFRQFLGKLGFGGRALALCRQVHGAKVWEAEAPELAGGLDFSSDRPEADALITDSSALVLAVSVADCVPVYLFDPVRRAIGLAHAGREGTQQAIAAHTVRKMGERFGSRPHELRAVIGPSAGPCCYEVDAGRAAAFAQLGYPVEGERRLDLWSANRLQLEEAGLAPCRIEVTRQCTICGTQFFSYRGGAVRARNLAVLALR
ncbi:MAG: peptidoglycan editing factor PgeF [Candidatus Hydrogenedentes bacterium]|nr:peptidoglycan editing factor PgeF [Candidatus Hydrogenedentota bacterium]